MVTHYIGYLLYSAENCLFPSKISLSIVNFMQQYWSLKILLMVFNRFKKTDEDKGVESAWWVSGGRTFLLNVINKPLWIAGFAFANLIVTFIIPVWYFSTVENTLMHNQGIVIVTLKKYAQSFYLANFAKLG